MFLMRLGSPGCPGQSIPSPQGPSRCQRLLAAVIKQPEATDPQRTGTNGRSGAGRRLGQACPARGAGRDGGARGRRDVRLQQLQLLRERYVRRVIQWRTRILVLTTRTDMERPCADSRPPGRERHLRPVAHSSTTIFSGSAKLLVTLNCAPVDDDKSGSSSVQCRWRWRANGTKWSRRSSTAATRGSGRAT